MSQPYSSSLNHTNDPYATQNLGGSLVYVALPAEGQVVEEDVAPRVSKRQKFYLAALTILNIITIVATTLRAWKTIDETNFSAQVGLWHIHFDATSTFVEVLVDAPVLPGCKCDTASTTITFLEGSACTKFEVTRAFVILKNCFAGCAVAIAFYTICKRQSLIVYIRIPLLCAGICGVIALACFNSISSSDWSEAWTITDDSGNWKNGEGTWLFMGAALLGLLLAVMNYCVGLAQGPQRTISTEGGYRIS